MVAAWIHFSVLALLSPVLLLSGKAAQLLRLPFITGYVLAGILIGPYCLRLLNSEALQALAPVDQGCLAVIAFSAGAELQIGDVRRIKTQVTYITIGICAFTWVSVFAMLMALAPQLSMIAGMPAKQSAAIVSLASTLMMARSPASMIAVLKETGGRGPYSSLIMAVVIVKDVLVFVCFAVNLEMADVVLHKSANGFSLGILVEPVTSLAISTALGLTYGVLIGRLIAIPACHFNYVLKRLSPAMQSRGKSFVRTATIALLAISIFWAALHLHAEPLLACVLAGIITTNRKGEAASSSIHEELGVALTDLMPIVNMAFFSLAGASLILGRVVATLWAAVGVWSVRLIAIYCGAWLGAFFGGTPTEYRRKIWQGMITQAGVAMGLAKAVAVRFPSWGPDFVFLMMSVIVMNLFCGPPLFRSAVISTGEARSLQLPSQSTDVSFPSPKKSIDGVDEEILHAASSPTGHARADHTHSPSL